MSNARIAVMDSPSMVRSIWCRDYGELSHAGRILAEHYGSLQQAQALVELGDLVRVERRLAPAPNERHDFAHVQPDVCQVFGVHGGGTQRMPAERHAGAEAFRLACVHSLDTYAYLMHPQQGWLVWARGEAGFVALQQMLEAA